MDIGKDEDFRKWLRNAGVDEIAEILEHYEMKRRLLWVAGSVDFYRRDRYDLDAVYATRIAACKERKETLGFA